ncbi:MAG: hypothetical protein OXC93_11705 [Rhodospirillaceae bacterium]|nr:hypothetical protein [Rhodospirillaceae bacterium]
MDSAFRHRCSVPVGKKGRITPLRHRAVRAQYRISLERIGELWPDWDEAALVELGVPHGQDRGGQIDTLGIPVQRCAA